MIVPMPADLAAGNWQVWAHNGHGGDYGWSKPVTLTVRAPHAWNGPVFNVYSFWGIIWVHLASTSVYFKVILLLPALRRVGASLEEAARVCGASQ